MNDREMQQVWVDFGFRSSSRPHDRVAQMEKLARHIRGEVCFLSYRGHSIQYASQVKQNLERKIGVKECILIPPGLLCRDNEVRRPVDYLRLVAKLWEFIRPATFFLYLHRDGFLQSYWTRMEVIVRSIDGSGFFGIDLDENGQLGADALQTGGDRTLASYTKTFIKSAMDPRLLNALGQFAQDYLVIPCGHCRQHFLLFAPLSSPQADYAVKCPWCAVSIRSWLDGGRYLVNSNISAAEFLCEDDILSLVATWPAQKHIASAPERVRIRMTGREFRIVR